MNNDPFFRLRLIRLSSILYISSFVCCLLFVSWQEIQLYLNAGRNRLEEIRFTQGLNIIPDGLTYQEQTLQLKKGNISLEELGSFTLTNFKTKEDQIIIEKGELFLAKPFLSNWQYKLFGDAANINLIVNNLKIKSNGQADLLKNVHFESIHGRGVIGHFEGFDFYQWGPSSWVEGTDNSHLFLKIKPSRFCKIKANKNKGYVFYQQSGTIHLIISDIKSLFYISKENLNLTYNIANNKGLGITTKNNTTISLKNLRQKPNMTIFFETELFKASGELNEGTEKWTIQTNHPLTWNGLLSKLTPTFKSKFKGLELEGSPAFISTVQINWKKGRGLKCLDLISGNTVELKELKAEKQ